MASGDFNRDMDSYLKKRKVVQRVNPLASARKYFSVMFAKKEEKEELPLDIPPEQVEAVLKQASIKKPSVMNTPLRSPTSGARKAAPQTKAPASAPTKTQSQVKPMGWFNNKKRQDEDYEVMETHATAQPVIDEEVKEVLKITFKWLKQMDPETVEEIKNSADFEKYKKVLDKYGLIKK